MNQKRLKELRYAKGYTQLQMQMKTGIDQSDYSKMERGKRELSLEQAVIIAEMFNTSVDYIIGLTNVKEPYPRNNDKNV